MEKDVDFQQKDSFYSLVYFWKISCQKCNIKDSQLILGYHFNRPFHFKGGGFLMKNSKKYM